MVRAMPPHPAGSACAGKIRSIARLPGRSPLPSVTLERVAAPRPPRTGPFGPSTGPLAKTFVPACVTLLTLAPTLSAYPVLRPSRKAGFPLMGLSKDRPSVVQAAESDSRVRPASVSPPGLALPSGWESRFPSACRPRGFSPPRRVVPPRPCGRIAGRCRSWGSPRFLPSRNGIPRDAPAALRSFPSADSYVSSATNRGRTWARITARPSPAVRSLRTLPPRPFLPRPSAIAVSCGASVRGPGPRGLAPSSGPLPVRPFQDGRARCSPGLGRLFRVRRATGLPPREREVRTMQRCSHERISVTSKTTPRSGSSV